MPIERAMAGSAGSIASIGMAWVAISAAIRLTNSRKPIWEVAADSRSCMRDIPAAAYFTDRITAPPASRAAHQAASVPGIIHTNAPRRCAESARDRPVMPQRAGVALQEVASLQFRQRLIEAAARDRDQFIHFRRADDQ